jgi:hypothetical protein
MARESPLDIRSKAAATMDESMRIIAKGIHDLAYVKHKYNNVVMKEILRDTGQIQDTSGSNWEQKGRHSWRYAVFAFGILTCIAAITIAVNPHRFRSFFQSEVNTSAKDPKDVAITTRLESERAALDKELKEIQSVKDKEVQIENDQKGIKLMLMEAIYPQRSMTIDAATDHEYRRLKTSAVDLLVKSESLTQIDNGFRLTVLVGNPSTIKLAGMDVQMEWGKPYPGDGDPKAIAQWLANLKKRDVTITDLFAAGKWTRIDLDLTPADESEVHAVSLRFEPMSFGLD